MNVWSTMLRKEALARIQKIERDIENAHPAFHVIMDMPLNARLTMFSDFGIRRDMFSQVETVLLFLQVLDGAEIEYDWYDGHVKFKLPSFAGKHKVKADGLLDLLQSTKDT